MSITVVPDAAYLAALSALPGMGPKRLTAVVEGGGPGWAWTELCSGSAKRSMQGLSLHGITESMLSGWIAAARSVDVIELWERHIERSVEVLTPASAGWPIDDPYDPDPPSILFGTGPLTGRQSPSVAIVGSRRSTHYGRSVAAMLGKGLASNGVTVVSGLATGIDGAAQRAAMDSGGRVVGVVGSGLDVIYPRSNLRLWSDVAERGRLWSEAPLGVEPARWRFPARNRIIAALADVVVVVESAAKGGSLHTVDAALERDRLVMAVPGPITSRQSLGTNRLLVQGSAPVSELDDVLVALGLAGSTNGQAPKAAEVPPVAEHLESVLEAVDYDGTSTDSVVARTGLDVSMVLSRLGELASQDLIADVGGWWQRA